ncbi:gp58-like family protein, partial [Niallia circulans]
SSVSQVQTNLDNLEIGGRNLVTNTSKDFKSVTFSSWDYIFKDKVMDWEKGMLLTGRIYLKPTSQEASIMIHVRYEDNTYSQYRGNIIKAGEEGYSTVTITVPNKDIKIIEYGIRHSSSSTPSDTVRYKEAKVEKGNKATDWTPAPEDMVTIAQFSTIEQTVNGITTRVGTSEGNISSLQQTASSFATRISNAEGNISSISQTLSGVQTTVSNKADKSTVTQLATVVDTKISTTDANNKFATQSQLTQTSNSLTSKISSVQTNLDNLEIGGRNLVQNGNFQSSHGWRTFQNVVKIDVVNDSTFGKVLEATIDSSSSSRQPAVAHNPVSVNEGEIYTYSVWIKRTTAGNGIVGMLLKFRNSSGGESNPIGGVTTDLQQGKWYRLVQTFTVPVGMVSVYGTPRITTSTVSTKFQIANVKLEKGNKATDFTPAPEDMATASQFSQLSDAINLRVTKDDLMTQINLNPQGILIQGKNLILDGNTTVNGSFRVASGNITSLDAGKVTTGTLDAAKVSVVNLNASNIKTGTLSG